MSNELITKNAAEIATLLQDTRSDEARVADAMKAIGLTMDAVQLRAFLREQVEDWVAKSERAVNGADFRQCKAQAQLHALLFNVVSEQIRKAAKR